MGGRSPDCSRRTIARQAALDELKDAVSRAIDGIAESILTLSHEIHADPEVAFEEYRAAGRICRFLEEAGYVIHREIPRLPTSFLAVTGNSAGPRIAICAEYDALPNLGHACGHNVVAAAAAGAAAGLAVAGLALPGRLSVVGTPAEEGGGGKVLLLEEGAFAGFDAAMMIHPSARNLVDRGSLASARVEIRFFGVARLADEPHGAGLSAFDAILCLFQSVNLLRSQLRPDARLHGIVSEGGTSSAIVPARTVAQFTVRASDREYLGWLLERLREAASYAAQFTRSGHELEVRNPYLNMVPNLAMADAFAANLSKLGRVPRRATGTERMGSTDMGNVSQEVPSIHAYVAITTEGISGHSSAFREAARSAEADEGTIVAAKALAMTALDLFYEPGLIERVKAEFERKLEEGAVTGPLSRLPDSE